jgi:8-oxo-dGTP pyrophosphatase MutT (NUDIX family)
MGTKIDWYDDPNAPPANSIVPAAAAVVINDHGQLLLIERSDNGLWALPGGAMDFGESLPQTAVRETKEETGYDIEITGLVGIYTDPKHRIEYTSNCEVRQEFSVVFTARPLAGEPTVNPEATKVNWFSPDQLAELVMHDSMRKRIRHFLDGEGRPHLG